MAYDPVSWDEVSTVDGSGGFVMPNGFGGQSLAQLPTDDEYYASLNGKNWGNLGDELKTIGATHGLTAKDFNAGFNSYLKNTGMDPYNEDAQTGRGVSNWWGNEAGKRAYLQGVGMNRPELANLYEQYYNPQGEAAQQQGIASNHDKMNAQMKANSGEWDWVPGLLAILGAGFGATSLMGAEGLGGAAAAGGAEAAGAGAGDVFGMGFGGYGPEGAGGIIGGASGAEAGSGMGTGAETGAAPDALEGMQGFGGFNSDTSALAGGEGGGGGAGGGYGGGGEAAGQPIGEPVSAPAASAPTGPTGIEVGSGGAPVDIPGIPEAAPTAPVSLGEPGPEFGMGYGGYGPEGQAAAPITDLSTKAPLTDQVRLASSNIPTGTSTAVDKAMKFLGITDDKGNMGKNALSLGGMALSQANASKSKNGLSNQLKEAAGPASAAAQQLLAQGLSGTAPAAVLAAADKTLNDRTQEVIQRYTNMGRDAKTDSAAQAEISKLKVARDASIQAYSQALTTQGLQAAGLAQGPTTQAALAGASEDKALSQSIAGMLQQMAMIQAMQSRAGAA